MAVTKVFNIVLRAKDEASGRIGGVTKQLIGMAAAIGGVTLAARFLKDSIAIGAKFGQTMATVGGVMRATAGEMENLTAIAREMGATTEFTATQSAEALRFLGMAGFTAKQSIAALPGTLDLATAGMLDLGTAADIATNTLTAMGLSVSDLNRVNDVLVGTATRSNTTIEMMAEAFKFAAPVANALGMNIEQLSGILGVLARSNIRAGIAGRNLATAMFKAKEIAADYNLENSDLISVLEHLNTVLDDPTDAIELFGIESAKVVLILMKEIEAVKELQLKLTDVRGEAITLANVMRDTTAGAFKEFTSAVEALQISIARSEDGIVNLAVKMATKMVRGADMLTRGFTNAERVTSDLNDALEQQVKTHVVFAETQERASKEMAAWGHVGKTTTELLRIYGADVETVNDAVIRLREELKQLTPTTESYGVLLSDMNPAIEEQANVLQQAGIGWKGLNAAIEDNLRLEREAIARKERLAELNAQAVPPPMAPEVLEVIERARAEARAAAMEVQQTWENMNALVLDSMVDTAQALANTMFGLKEDFAAIFKSMAQDFLMFFLREILMRTAASFTAFLLTGPLGFLGGAAAGGAAGGAAGATLAGVPAGLSLVPAGVPQINISIATVIGEDQYVQETLMPAMARAISLGANRVGPRGM